MRLRRPFVFKWDLLQDRCPCCGWRLKATDMIASPSGKMFSLAMCRNSKCAARPSVRVEGDRPAAVAELKKVCKKEGAK